LRLRPNRPLLTLLNKQAGDPLFWSPIWWRDDAEPYGRIILRQDQPPGLQRTLVIEKQGRETVYLSLRGPRNTRLWFPVPTITHYAIAQFSPHRHGIVFNPLDGFQRSHSIRPDSPRLNGIPRLPTLPASRTALPDDPESPDTQMGSDDSNHTSD
jgi:hypothetical protein